MATHELYERHAAKLQAYCQHRLGSREEAEDAVQTVFMNVFRALREGVVPEAELAWLYKIAENVCLSRHRSTRRRGRVETPNDFEVLGELVPAPARGAREELFGLEEALAAMPEQQRRAILLREWQGLSYREIAAVLELSQSAVEALIFRARRSLARELSAPERRTGLRRALKAFDLGTLAAAVKTLFEGAAAVKATATAVAVTAAAGAAVSAGPPVLDRVREPKPAPPAGRTEPDARAARVVVVASETARPISAPSPRRAAAEPSRTRVAPSRRRARTAAAPAPAVAHVPTPAPPVSVPPPPLDATQALAPGAQHASGEAEQRGSGHGGGDRAGAEATREEKGREERSLRADERRPDGLDRERPADRPARGEDEDKRTKKSEKHTAQQQPEPSGRAGDRDKHEDRGKHDDNGKPDDEPLAASPVAAVTPVATITVPVEPPAASSGSESRSGPDAVPPAAALPEAAPPDASKDGDDSEDGEAETHGKPDDGKPAKGGPGRER